MPRNLIVVVFDTLRYDAVFGDLAETPNLRRFAEQSVVFDNAWGEGLPTIPFRRALHTGMRSYPWRRRGPERGSFPSVLGWHAIPDDQTTMAEYLYGRGYVTQLVSDVWHMFKPTMNFARGFVSWDFVRGQENDVYRFGAASLAEGRAIDPTRLGPPSYLHQVRERTHDDDYFVAQVFDRGCGFVEEMAGEGPYCLWVESFAPHEFWDPPLRFADAYHPAPAGVNYIVPQHLNGRDPSAEDIARTRALYQGYCTFCDERFGRFLRTLEQSGELERSVVAVVSDHGTEVWDKGRFGKAADRLHPYNAQINLMIRHPDGVGAGRRVDAFAQNQDLVPTLLALLDVPHPRLDGDDLWPLVTGGPGSHALESRDHVVTGWAQYASVRDRAWNLVVDTRDPGRELRLYDLVADPCEDHNVAADHPDVITHLLARLEAVLGSRLPAVYQHQPDPGPAATPGGLRLLRRQGVHEAQPGESWIGSNQV